MTTPPHLFDRDLRALRRDRAARDGRFADADYLHRAAAAGFVERLEPVNRAFPHAVVLGAAHGVYADAIAGRFGVEQIDAMEGAPALARQSAARCADLDPPALEEGRYDLLLIGLELHAVNDPIGTLVAARRALKPDGLMLACMFGGETLRELRAALAEAEITVRGGLSPRVAPMAELRDLGGLLMRAGYAMPAADADRLEIWQPNFSALLADIRAMGEANCLVERSRSFTPARVFAMAGALYAERHARADGKLKASVELIYLAGWAPAADQPQPLRPGSAAVRLADALGAAERKLPGD
ncbi:MAG: class I SAM-dependent methyltransferase [Neomegalonema sp.]|nr:class I SAM-dependent methyltransferase [Neomegalonema sp.]